MTKHRTAKPRGHLLKVQKRKNRPIRAIFLILGTKFCIFVRFESRFVRFESDISKKSCTFAADFDIHMHMLRRIHSILLLLALLIGTAGMSYVQAATYSGSCGTNATWSYNTINYKLTISGSGAMTNYTSSSPAPWDSYKKSILTISIANTITSIGDYAFASCTKVPSVSMGTGLKSIGSNAFKGCSSLSRAMIPFRRVLQALARKLFMVVPN